jgi:hypothetical protein
MVEAEGGQHKQAAIGAACSFRNQYPEHRVAVPPSAMAQDRKSPAGIAQRKSFATLASRTYFIDVRRVCRRNEEF